MKKSLLAALILAGSTLYCVAPAAAVMRAGEAVQTPVAEERHPPSRERSAAPEEPLLQLNAAAKYSLVTVAGCLALLAWSFVLTRKLRSRTRHLQEELAKRIAAEQSLRSSEEEYRALYRDAVLGIFRSGFDGRFIDVNPALARMLGYDSPEEVLACVTSIPRQIYADPPVYDTVARQVLEGGGALVRENRYRRRDGSLWWGLLRLRIVREPQGKASYYQGFVEDITERKRIEKTLVESEARYRELFENNPQPMWVYDLKTLAFLAVNDVAVSDYGYSREEFLNMTILDIHPPEKRQELLETVRHAPGPLRKVGVWPQRWRDGTLREVEITTHDLSFAGRNARLTLANDITERRQAEKDRERLTVAIEAAGEIVMVTNVRGTIQYVNPVFEAVTGYSRAEVVGKSSKILKSNEQSAALYCEARDAIATGVAWRGRLVNSRKDGTLFTVDTTISPVRDEAGRIVNYVSVERDVTEHLRLVEERSGLESQLRQAQKMEAIGRLAGGVAHDFNNLTAIVLGYGEMLLGALRPEEPAHKWAEQIVAAGKRSATLTRQLLAFSRRQVLLPVVMDLNVLLHNLEKMLSRLIGEDIALKFALEEDLGRITADPGQIEQVVTNLVINARDAMPRGGRLTVETANVDLDEAYAQEHKGVVPGEYVRLVLADTGCGMDKPTLARLFEPFFTTKQRGKGTGLGLATAFGIVKQSGGYLFVDSEPGAGTTFTIYLPRTNAQPKASAIENRGETPRGGGERILLVEDETSLRELCESVLSRLGYRVSAVAGGAQALDLVAGEGFEPDLLVTDVIMPEMSGAELVQRLRSDRPELKVLYMSGYPDEAIAPHGVLAPGMCFLQKPFSESVLAVKVREALESGRCAAAPRRASRVLMIDDDEQYLDLVGHFCRKRGHGFVGVSDPAAALAALAGQSFDVLLVDLNIPGTSGERVLRDIRAAGHAAPAIVLTGDVAAADMNALRPLGVVQVAEKSSAAEPLLRAIEAAGEAAGREAPPGS